MGRKKKTADGSDDSGFSKKWEKKLPQGFKDVADSYDTDTIKKKIVEYEKAISATEKDMDADPKLSGLKDRMKDLKDEIKEASEVYTLTISESNASIRYLVYVLEGRGEVVSD